MPILHTWKKDAQISQALMEMNKKILYFLKERTNTRYQTLQNNLGDLGSSQNLQCHHKKHCKTQNTILVVLIITSRDYPFCTEVSRPRNREGSYSFRWDKYEGLPKGADPKSRVSKAARPGVVKAESSSAVRVIKSIQEHLNVQGSGVAGIVVLSSQTLGSICLRVKESVCVRERERESESIQTSDSHYLISALRDRQLVLHFQQKARTGGGGSVPLLCTNTWHVWWLQTG